jgi:DNA-binding transcriptional LysR family regulator
MNIKMTDTIDHEMADAISFRQLKLFESIGRLHSVRKASEECNLSQPAVTQALAKLEQRVGATLVERRASGSYLNEAGTIFLRRTARFFEQTEQALVELGVPGGASGAKAIANRLSRAQIRCLVAIVDHGSFASAADALGVSHASLQRATRDLEGNLRKSLFHRSAVGMLLGPHGSEFGRRMKLALQEVEWGIREIEAVKGGFATELSIGGMPFGGSILLAMALDEFVHVYPQVSVRVTIENAPSMHRSLRGGEVDLVVGLLPEVHNDELACVAFSQTPYSVVGRVHHPLLRKGNVTIDELLGYDWVVGTHGSSRRACFERLFEGHGKPRAPIATCALPGLRNLLADSDRLTLMTSYEIEQEHDGLAQIPFRAIDLVPTMGVTMRAGWLPTKMHQDFVEIVRRKTATGTRVPALRKVVG